jgi:hypothetical protein
MTAYSPISLAEALAEARRLVLVRRPLHWQLASALIAHLEAARGELARQGHAGGADSDAGDGSAVFSGRVVIEPEQS